MLLGYWLAMKFPLTKSTWSVLWVDTYQVAGPQFGLLTILTHSSVAAFRKWKEYPNIVLLIFLCIGEQIHVNETLRTDPRWSTLCDETHCSIMLQLFVRIGI